MEAGKVEYLFLSGCQYGPVCFTLDSQEELRSSSAITKTLNR